MTQRSHAPIPNITTLWGEGANANSEQRLEPPEPVGLDDVGPCINRITQHGCLVTVAGNQCQVPQALTDADLGKVIALSSKFHASHAFNCLRLSQRRVIIPPSEDAHLAARLTQLSQAFGVM